MGGGTAAVAVKFFYHRCDPCLHFGLGHFFELTTRHGEKHPANFGVVESAAAILINCIKHTLEDLLQLDAP